MSRWTGVCWFGTVFASVLAIEIAAAQQPNESPEKAAKAVKAVPAKKRLA